MKNETILKFLNDNKVEELKQLIIEEIGKETNKAMPTFKAILNLSKDAEKTQRNSNFSKTKNYIRPLLAGAYFFNDYETMICNGYYGAIFNGNITGLQMVNEVGDYLNLHEIITDETIKKYKDVCNYNLNDIKNELKVNKEYSVQLNSSIYDAKLFIKMIECFEDVKIFNDANNENSMLLFKGNNGIGVLCPLRQI